MRNPLATALVCLLLAVACDAPERLKAKPTASEGERSAQDAPSSEPSFSVVTEVPPTCVGEASLARVSVTPESPWHINLEFPTALGLEASESVEVIGDHQGREDARRLDEDGIEFSVMLTPSRTGELEIHGEVSFALCGAVECAPQREPVSLVLRARPAATC